MRTLINEHQRSWIPPEQKSACFIMGESPLELASEMEPLKLS